MSSQPAAKPVPLDPAKFRHPRITARGERRAAVELRRLRTLWVNTGTLCNLTCGHCYIESSPTNDRLAYISRAEVAGFLDEIEVGGLGTEEIGFTGGEPFMNPDIVAMLDDVLRRGHRALVLTNAMRPMQRLAAPLLDLHRRFGPALTLRVSLDHYGPAIHDGERGAGSFEKTLAGLCWAAAAGFRLHVAGRGFSGESEERLRAGYARLFADRGIAVDAGDPAALVLFPEMDAELDVPEITEGCWDILKVSPDAMMCASSRMVVKRRGAARPAVVSCTLLPYDPRFEMGATLAEASAPVPLNHPHCARFCVLGGGSCSRG